MEKNFTYHKVSKEEKQEIKEKAKHIMDEFSSKLDSLDAKEKHFDNSLGTRKEGDGWKTSEEFKNLFLENAPFIQDDFLIAEKGGWKK